jgi:hypothetical protein
MKATTTTEKRVRVYVLTSVLHDGRSYAKGEEMDIPESAAERLLRLGGVTRDHAEAMTTRTRSGWRPVSTRT